MARILMIDDDPDIVMATRIPLEANGYEVFAASSGEEGLKKLRTIEPDLIILDGIVDATAEGLHLSFKLRDPTPDAEYAAYRDVPILVLTSVRSMTERRFAPDEGYLPVDAFLEKSAEPAQVVAKVRELIHKA